MADGIVLGTEGLLSPIEGGLVVCRPLAAVHVAGLSLQIPCRDSDECSCPLVLGAGAAIAGICQVFGLMRFEGHDLFLILIFSS